MTVIQIDAYRSRESLQDMKVNKLIIAIERMCEKQKAMMDAFGKGESHDSTSSDSDS